MASSNHQGESREVLLEMIVRCYRFCGVQLQLVVPWQMGVGHSIGLQRKCGSAVRCMRSSSVTLALHGGLPWVRERRMTESRPLA